MLNKKRYITFISAVVSLALLMTSCSISKEKFNSAWEHFGENLNEAMGDESDPSFESEIEETSETTETEEETTETSEDPTVTPTEVPEATNTPTPTEIPDPERVDFSELTEDVLTDTITVETEAFAESYVLDDDDETLIAEFEGSRMLILAQDVTNVQVAVNLILDGFYEEANGMYHRYINEALAERELLPEEDLSEFVPVKTIVNYEYGFNGRVLSVEMTYEVTREDEVIKSSLECVSFDLYTGSYIMLENIISDMDGFLAAARAQLAFTLGDEEVKPEDFSEISIMARNDDSSFYIVGTTATGERVQALVDINDYSAFMTRYGRIIF